MLLALSEACFAFIAIVALSQARLSSWLTLSLIAAWGIHALMLIRFLRDSARAARNLVIAKDVADQATLTRGAFLSTMSHEIRTPMNAVLGMTGLLRSTRLDSQQQEFAKAIEDSANALLGIVNDVLDFSKIDVGKMDIAVVEFDLRDIVEASVEVLSFKAREKNVRLLTHIETTLPRMLLGDPGRIRQILLNLLGNALKFTNSGEVVLKVLRQRNTGGQVHLRFEVQDSGIGMDGETMQRLFSPFSQADSSVTRKYGGTGLGLSISKRLVDLMGGRIGVSSTMGNGSCFWFELGIPVSMSGDADKQQTATEGMQVALVEPHDQCAAMLMDYLTASGFKVVRHETGQDALLALQGIGQQLQAVIISTQIQDLTPVEAIESLQRASVAKNYIMLDHATHTLNMDGRQQCGVLQLPFRRKQLLGMLFDSSSNQETQMKDAMPFVSFARPRQGKILLVEDNLMNQKVALYQLNAMGYTVEVASNGAEAMEKLGLHTYVLVLMDCQMPVLDGYETTRRIRRIAGNVSRIPIVAMTANAMAGDRERCLEAGMDDYITKPLLRAQLVAALEKHIPQAPEITSPVAIINETRLDELFGEDEKLANEMLGMFIEHTSPLVQELAKLTDLRDIPIVEVRALGHRLAGSCLNLGAEVLGDLGRQIEGATLHGDLEKVRSISKECALAFDELSQSISNRRMEKK
jgi:signal transduction histidine kinase/CheY-like chemotaxis protein/HPt (histidine-containing phosphotransfer) domain-containing protein